MTSWAAWAQIESDLAGWMKDFSQYGLTFCAGRQCIPGFPVDGFRADGLLTNGRVLLALEVELKQNHPDTNVGKYWLLTKHKKYEKVVLFHLYTPAFDSYGWRKTLGDFYAERMQLELPFEYILLDRRKATDANGTFEEVCSLLRQRIHKEFAHELHAAPSFPAGATRSMPRRG